jgi:hypothetical protein
MILLHDQKIAVMTLPKCATNTLHAALRRKKWNGETFVGYSTLGTNTYDRHVNIWPHETRRYKKVVTCRNPYNRLVSLYLHFTTREAGHGRPAPSFQEYVQAVMNDDPNLEKWYKWNLSMWTENVEIDHLLHCENLQQDLEATGLAVKNLPFLNKNYRAQRYVDFFNKEGVPDEEMMDLVHDWCDADCQKFGYQHEVHIGGTWN